MPRPKRATAVLALAGRLLPGSRKDKPARPAMAAPAPWPAPGRPRLDLPLGRPDGSVEHAVGAPQANGPTSSPSGPTWWGAARPPTCA